MLFIIVEKDTLKVCRICVENPEVMLARFAANSELSQKTKLIEDLSKFITDEYAVVELDQEEIDATKTLYAFRDDEGKIIVEQKFPRIMLSDPESDRVVQGP